MYLNFKGNLSRPFQVIKIFLNVFMGFSVCGDKWIGFKSETYLLKRFSKHMPLSQSLYLFVRKKKKNLTIRVSSNPARVGLDVYHN